MYKPFWYNVIDKKHRKGLYKQSNYIINILNLKDNRITFKENFYSEQIIKGFTYKVFETTLSYKPKCCKYCGVIFDDNFEKHGFITSRIKLPSISGFKTLLVLHKQRYLCKHCNHAFTLSTPIVNDRCFISNNTKYHIVKDLTKKISEKDIALKHNDYNLLITSLNNNTFNISDYMKTSIKSLKSFLPYIKNTFETNYHNGFIEGNNNFIKVLKRIAFGFRSFRRFKTRIMICKGLILPNKKIENV